MEDVFSQARRVAEDGCTYDIFPPAAGSTASEAPTDLSTSLADVLAYCLSLSRDYLWHKDTFNLEVDEPRQCLKGSTRVSDCIEDEWFVVWLLRSITQEWKGSTASILDVDGNFLLIEAADALPRWVTPDNSENRVWLHQGQLHLISLQHTSPAPQTLDPDEAKSYLSAVDAVSVVQDPNINTAAPEAVQKAVFDRIDHYPDAVATSHLHNTLAYLPTEVGLALSKNPQLIAPAVTAFYERDPLQLKACQVMKRFPLEPSALSKVRMTRTLYAQLMGQKFFPPKPFERVNWLGSTVSGSPSRRHKEMGMKIACGFEMLYDDTKDRLKVTKTSRTHEDDTHSQDPAFKRFLGNLTKLGYFQGELPGSQKYMELLRQAQMQFTDMRADANKLPAFSEQVELALKQVQQESTNLPETLEEDSDDWMTLDEEGLEQLLQSKAGPRGEDEAMEGHAQNLTGLAAKFEDFVQGRGDLEGAMFDDEMDDDDPASDSDDERPHIDESQKQKDMDSLVPSLGREEWGRKESAAQPTSAGAASQPLPEKPESRFEPEKYEGASDDEDSPSEGDGDDAPIQELDDETAEKQDINMGDEMHDFLRFTREALGLSESQYNDILKSRSDRGAFVPGDDISQTDPRSSNMDVEDNLQSNVPAPSTSSRVSNSQPSSSVPHFHLNAPQKNPKLDNFEALMDAMDGALEEAKAQRSSQPKPPSQSASAQKSSVIDDGDDDMDPDLAAKLSGDMDSELAELLKHDPDDEGDRLQPSQYNLLKNLLASYDSQAGAAGPVSNMAGRMAPGVRIPANES